MKNLELDFFKIENKIEPRKGSVLFSGPFLNDIYFSRSVVVLAEHNDEGTVGFVINKPVKFNIKELMPGFPDFHANISIGGPVNTNSIHYIHTLGNLLSGSVELQNGLYWGGNFEILVELILNGAINAKDIKFFIGYSGWAKGQLADELQENSWIVSELTTREIMKNNNKIWSDKLIQMGNKYKFWANFPENPGLN
jgi:putative transcriptional regulator